MESWLACWSPWSLACGDCKVLVAESDVVWMAALALLAHVQAVEVKAQVNEMVVYKNSGRPGLIINKGRRGASV